MLGLRFRATRDEDGAKEDRDEERRESEKGVADSAVVKVIEVIGTSEVSFDDAIAAAIRTAARSLRHISGADVMHMTVVVKGGEIAEYRVDLKVAFALD